MQMWGRNTSKCDKRGLLSQLQKYLNWNYIPADSDEYDGLFL